MRVSYRFTTWFWRVVHCSPFFLNDDRRDNLTLQQHDVAVSAPFDINAYRLIKCEAHFMAGMAGLKPCSTPA